MYCMLSEQMSDWLLFKAIWAIWQLYYRENKLRRLDLMMSALNYTNTLCSIFVVFDYWSNSPRVDMSHHIILIPNQLVFALSP
jgi:hypothetical protein